MRRAGHLLERAARFESLVAAALTAAVAAAPGAAPHGLGSVCRDRYGRLLLSFTSTSGKGAFRFLSP